MKPTTLLLPNKYYHIYNHANGGDDLFSDEANYRFFLKKYAEYVNPLADTFAYCLMPNHFHLLIRVKSEDTLKESAQQMNKLSYLIQEKTSASAFDSSRFMSHQFSHFFNSYTQAYNKYWKRMGSLMRPNYKRKEIQHEHYFTRLIYYIHLNPVHHRFSKEVADWKFSSYQAILSDKPTSLRRSEVLSWFGGSEAYIRFHQKPVTDEIRNEFNL